MLEGHVKTTNHYNL